VLKSFRKLSSLQPYYMQEMSLYKCIPQMKKYNDE
jgi:hypothetical protein